MRLAKNWEGVTYTQEKKWATEITFDYLLMSDLPEKYFIADIINVFKELKEKMLKQIRKDMMTLSH